MFTFIMILIAILAVLITLVVLVQSGKGGGLAGMAAGGATSQILGARQAPDVLEKATWTFAALFIVLCILSNFFISRDQVQESVIQQRAQGQTQGAPAVPPAGGTTTPGGTAPQGGQTPPAAQPPAGQPPAGQTPAPNNP